MGIRKLKECEIDCIMKIWLESTIEAHNFIGKKYWKKNYNIVKDLYIPMAETFVFCDKKGIHGFKIIKEQNNEDSGFVEYLMIYNSP